MKRSPVDSLLEYYPKIFLACHTRHVRDPETGEAVSSAQAGILDHLDEVDGIGLNDLARHMGVTPGTMSIAVERLVTKGYVTRDRDEKDGRRVLLRLTAAGARVREAQTVLDPELVAALLDRLSPAEREEGLRGLEILARGAAELLRSKSEAGTWSRRRAASSEGTERKPSKRK